MAPSYKLVYFNVRGRGEIVRLILHAAGVNYIDERVEFADWPALKPKAPNGMLPYLEIDGKPFPESLCLARFLARQYNLMGKSETDQLKVDIVLAQCDAIKNDWVRYMFDKVCTDAQKAELKKKFQEETFPAFVARMEKQLNDNGSDFLVGDSMTLADISVLDITENAVKENAAVLDKYPKVAALRKRLETTPNLAKYLASRPETTI